MPGIAEDEYIAQDAVGLAALVRRREIAPLELLEVAIARAERITPAINAIVTPMYDLARAQAAAIGGSEPLAGVPFLLKDLRASYKGVRSTAGSAWMSAVPDFYSTVTTRYRRAGLLMMGKTNVPEMGLPSTRRTACSGRPGTRGTSTAPPVGQAAGRRPRSRRGSCPRPMPATVPGQRGYLPPTAARSA